MNNPIEAKIWRRGFKPETTSNTGAQNPVENSGGASLKKRVRSFLQPILVFAMLGLIGGAYSAGLVGLVSGIVGGVAAALISKIVAIIISKTIYPLFVSKQEKANIAEWARQTQSYNQKLQAVTGIDREIFKMLHAKPPGLAPSGGKVFSLGCLLAITNLTIATTGGAAVYRQVKDGINNRLHPPAVTPLIENQRGGR